MYRTELCDPDFATSKSTIRINEIPTKAFAALVADNITDVRSRHDFTNFELMVGRIIPILLLITNLFSTYLKTTARWANPIFEFPNLPDLVESHFSGRQQ